jgi:hypothetical protein
MLFNLFSRQVRVVMSSALLLAGFAACSGAGNADTDPAGAPDSEETVAGIPQPNGCFANFDVCQQQADFLNRDADFLCFCTTEIQQCGRDLAALLCDPNP